MYEPTRATDNPPSSTCSIPSTLVAGDASAAHQAVVDLRRATSPPHTGHLPNSRNSRSSSLDAPATFDRGLHIGSNSGVSFLYRWQEGAGQNGVQSVGTVPLACYGDPPSVRAAACPYLDAAEGRLLMYAYTHNHT